MPNLKTKLKVNPCQCVSVIKSVLEYAKLQLKLRVKLKLLPILEEY